MRDGKALQMSTSHELGDNFARAFDIRFQDESGESVWCHTTSWGSSTRLVGGLIMAHGDDDGLVLPPRLAPVQVAVVAVREEASVIEACERIATSLRGVGLRVEVDRGRASLGRRITDWELKGVPVRVEVGPRDLAEGVVTVSRRDGGRETVAPDRLAAHLPVVLETIQEALLDGATARRDAATVDAASLDEAVEAAQSGFARLPWSLVGEEGEQRLNERAVSVRCLQRPDASTPESPDEADLVCVVARAY